jgi:ubiquitin carboxyl-terminal hydrolase 8
MNIEDYKDKGLSGLANLGNTCFVNSCVQILSHTYELNSFLKQETYKSRLKRTPGTALLVEWDELRKMLWGDNCIISPGKFIKTVQKVAEIKGTDLFTGFSQNDLPEFLLFIIDCFHTALSREIRMTISGTPSNTTDNIAIQCFEMIKNMYSKEYSEIWNLFYAVHVSEISDLKTGESLKITPEPYFMIDLPIPSDNKSPTLIDCFNLYVEGEVLDGENGWINEATKERIDIKKKIQFWSFPNILVIDLKRFNTRLQKSQVLVTFPMDNLDLSEYVIGYKKNSYKYELYGVCNHSGGVMGGHYTAYVKNANGKWYHFNDTSVSEVGLPESIVSPKAYVLFYRKKAN